MNDPEKKDGALSAQEFMQKIFSTYGSEDLPKLESRKRLAEIKQQARDYLLDLGGGNMMRGVQMVNDFLKENDAFYSRPSSNNSMGRFLKAIGIIIPPNRVEQIQNIIERK